jgi:hypothetical protein
MLSRKIVLSGFSAILLVLIPPSKAQDAAAFISDRVLTLTEQQIEEIIERAVSERLPPTSIDALTLLLLNREDITLPKVAKRLRDALEDPSKPGELIMKLEELLAYVPSSASWDVLLSLEREHEPHLERVLPLALSHSVARRNPFDLAYRVIERSSDNVKGVVIKWVEDNGASEQNSRDWARLLLQRNKGVVNDSTLARDPLYSRMNLDRRLLVKPSLDRELRRLTAPRQ